MGELGLGLECPLVEWRHQSFNSIVCGEPQENT